MSVKRILTVFCGAENVHLVKDVGMIPYLLHKEHGYSATLACYKNGEYPYLQNEVKGLEIVFIKRIFNKPSLDVLYFLMFNARKYDILMTFHLGLHSLLWFWFYKLLNASGVTYLKLDLSIETIDSRLYKNKKVIRFLKKIDVISCETKMILKKLETTWKQKIEYIPNGFYNFDKIDVTVNKKEKIILSVGRLSSVQKNIKILVNVFCKLSHSFQDWKLVLVGDIHPNTLEEFNLIKKSYDIADDKIIFTGNIEDRKILDSYYQKATIFALPSLYEGFALVYLEAAKEGCYILSSDIPPAFDITDNGRLGTLFKNNDITDLEDQLNYVISNYDNLQNLEGKIKKNAYDHFYWPVIVDKLDKILKEKLNGN